MLLVAVVAAVFGFAQAAQEAILNRVSGFKHTEPFTGVAYTLEDTDFSVSGFEAGWLTASCLSAVSELP